MKSKIGKVNKKVVVDFLGGVGVQVKESFKEMGLNIIPLHDKPDAKLYGFHRLEPWGDLLSPVKEAIKKENADFAVAFDCDADRCIFIDSLGNYVSPSIVDAIFIEYILKRKKGKVISTYDCATELEKFAKDRGGKLIWWRVGHGFIEQKCIEEKALFAGEQSSHFFFNEFYPFSDGTLSTLYLAKILSETGKTFDELISEINFHPIEKIYINAETDERKEKVIKELKKDFSKSQDIMDGFKVKLNDIEWILIRASQTLPEINLCIEAKNKKRLMELVEKYSKLIEQKLRDVK